MEMVSNLITRYKIVEELYLSRPSPVRDELTKALLKLYGTVLVYLGKAGKYYKQNTPGKSVARKLTTCSNINSERVVKSAIQSPETYIKQILEEETRVRRYLHLMASEGM
jgi:hypothetical protein